MYKLNDQQVIKALKDAEHDRFTKEDHYDELMNKGGGLTKDVCRYGAECNVDSYEHIMDIAGHATRQTSATIRKSVVNFVCELSENRKAYRAGKMTCKQYFKQSGFSAFGMSRCFDMAIKDIENQSSKRLEIFARLGA